MGIRENIIGLKEKLPAHVTLVAVSKTKSNEMIMEAYGTGHLDFGENYVRELADKHDLLPKDIRWHFIGHLQSNKVKYIAPFVYLIHGVDSLKLLQEINKQAMKCKRIIPCLLQIYIANEETKFGLSPEECELLFEAGEIKKLPNINIRGLMAMASNTKDQEKIKEEFQMLMKLHSKIESGYFKLPVLSFGMSSDYELAISAGSNMVRIGSAIFGERNYKTVQ